MGKKHLDVMDLQIFQAILSEGNVSRAASSLGLNQSAVSKGLSNLRLIFRDPLFVRSGAGMRPTHKALEIQHTVSQSVRLLEDILSDRPHFDPGSAKVHFTLGLSDYGSYVLLPDLIKRLSQHAPNVTLQTIDIHTHTAEDLLLTSKVDLCLASDASFTHPIHHAELFQDHFVCLMRANHPLAQGTLGLPEFLACKHLVMPRQGGGAAGVVEQALATLGKERQVAARVSSLLSIPEILAGTDLLLTTTSKVAMKLQKHADLVFRAHPLQLPTLRFTQLWHARDERSASHKWLREQIHRCATNAPDAHTV